MRRFVSYTENLVMKTHRLVFKCNTIEFAKYLENDILHVEFCDLTHWYCGFDDAGEDTPDCCVIFRGIVHPETVYVEIDLKQSGLSVEDLKRQYGNLQKRYENDDTRRIEDFRIEDLT